MQLLEKVKNYLGITGTYQDATISGYIDEVKQFLLSGGVKKDIVEAEETIGLISIGVKDLWNYGNGNTTLSQYFMQRAIQLGLKGGGSNEL